MIWDIEGEGVQVLWRCFDKEGDNCLTVGSKGVSYDEVVSALEDSTEG